MITFIKSKLYLCATAASMSFLNSEIPETHNDYFDINSVTIEQLQNKLFDYVTPFDRCAFCNRDRFNDIHPWSLSNLTTTQYLYTKTIKDLYLYDYTNYDKLINNFDQLNNTLSNLFFINHFDFDINLQQINQLLNRFYNSQSDICILYDSSCTFHDIDYILLLLQ
jgi:hypothetical protein